MRTFKAILTALFLWTCIGPSGRALAATIDFEVNATVTVTNVNGTTNGQTITYSTDARTWTNNPTVNTLKFLQATNSIGFVATNLALHFVRAPFGDGVSMSGSGTNFIKFLSQLNSNLTISLSPGWATVVYKTNNYTNQVPVSAPIIAEPNPVVATNIISGIIEAFPWATNSVPEFIAALNLYVSLNATQTLSWKALQSGSLSNMQAKYLFMGPTNRIDIIPTIGGPGFPDSTNSGIRFGGWGSPGVYMALIPEGEEPFIHLVWVTNGAQVAEADVSPYATYQSGVLLNILSAVKMFPIMDGPILQLSYQPTNNFHTANIFSVSTNEFLTLLKASGGIAASGGRSTLTNADGAFVGLTVLNLQGLGGYLSNLFGNSITLSNAPVIHVLNLQGLGGYLSNLFAQSITISNAASINGIIGLLTGGSWSNATINGLAESNSVWSGTNVVTGDISYPWFDLSSIGAGNNIAVPLGTNTFVALSGNGGAAALCGFAGLRNGKPVKLLNRSGFAMSLVQTTIDPVPANRIVGNIAGDLAFNPGEWVDIIWDNAAARWRFVVPLAAGTNFVTSGRSDTNLSVFPSSSNNVPLRVFAAVNHNTNIQQWMDGNSNTLAAITSTGTVFTAGNAAIINTNNFGTGRVMKSDAGGVGRWADNSFTVSFGDGSDGAAIMDGSIVPAGTTLVAANTYRLDRDVYWSSLYVSNNITFKTGNHANSATWRVFVSGTVTNAGTIQNAGVDGGNAVGPNTAGAGGGSSSTGSLGGSCSGGNGRAGGTGAGPGGIPASPGVDPAVGGTGGVGGAGGNGVSGGGGGGVTGTYQNRRHSFMSADLFAASASGTLSYLKGGNGGGGGGAGGGNGTGNGGASGGGGGGGGILFVWASRIVNSGAISGNGGNGGNGIVPTGAGAGAQGGGAGGAPGGGGLVYLAYNTISNSGSITATAGTVGTGAAGVTGGSSGANGNAASNGEVLKFNVNTGLFE